MVSPENYWVNGHHPQWDGKRQYFKRPTRWEIMFLWRRFPYFLRQAHLICALKANWACNRLVSRVRLSVPLALVSIIVSPNLYKHGARLNPLDFDGFQISLPRPRLWKPNLELLPHFPQRMRYQPHSHLSPRYLASATRDFDRPFPLNCGRSLAKAAGYSHQTSTWNSFPNPLCFYSFCWIILDHFKIIFWQAFFGYCSRLKIPAIGDETRGKKNLYQNSLSVQFIKWA
jgi:hypothetical protein